MNQQQYEDPGTSGCRYDQIAEELRMLLEATASRAEGYLNGLGAAAGDDAAGTGRRSTSASCGWCPVCAVVSIVQGERPELTARLTEQLTGLVTLLRQTLTEEQRRPGTADAGVEPEAEQSAKVQRIGVHRVNGRVLGAERKC